MGYIKKEINYYYFYLLLLLLPIIQLVSYLLSPPDGDPLDYRAYPSMIIFGILMYYNKSSFYVYIILAIFISYTFFFDVDTLTGRAGYMLDYCLTCLALITVPKIKFKRIDVKIVDKGVIILCYGIIISYLATLKVTFLMEEERVYLAGFIIPHAFSYLMAIFTYYLLKRKKLVLAIIPFLFGAFSGTRTGLILCSLSVIAVFLTSVTKKNILIIFLFGGLFLGSFFYIASEFPVFNRQVESVTNSISGFNFSTSNNNQKSIDYTSQRSLLFATGMDQIINDGISFENILGRGPRASYYFFENKLGWALWFHNDFMDILFSLGLINLIFYIVAICSYYYYSKNIFFLIFIVFSAFTNGFFFYSSFVIICIHYLSIYFVNYENPSDK